MHAYLVSFTAAQPDGSALLLFSSLVTAPSQDLAYTWLRRLLADEYPSFVVLAVNIQHCTDQVRAVVLHLAQYEDFNAR